MNNLFVNHSKLPAGSQGFYESFFQRANHPTRPLGFWTRYTLLVSKNKQAVAELWAAFFDGEAGRCYAGKQSFPLSQALFRTDRFEVTIGEARLGAGFLEGQVIADHSFRWDLTYRTSSGPLGLLPPSLYQTRFPASKSLIGSPLARFDGRFKVDGREIPIEGWVGSEGHNWGRRHTDEYLWGEVAGFDSNPSGFLELASARLRLGPWWLPRLTPVVLRNGERETRLNSVVQSFRATSSFKEGVWSFKSANEATSIEGVISAPRELFVEFLYENPSGEKKRCLHSGLASSELKVTDRRTGQTETWIAKHRAALEILR